MFRRAPGRALRRARPPCRRRTEMRTITATSIMYIYIYIYIYSYSFIIIIVNIITTATTTTTVIITMYDSITSSSMCLSSAVLLKLFPQADRDAGSGPRQRLRAAGAESEIGKAILDQTILYYTILYYNILYYTIL